MRINPAGSLGLAIAQMGPVHLTDPREAVVARLVEMLREASARGADFLVFPELALTTFFPRHGMCEDDAVERFFEKTMPNAAVQPLFDEARRLRIGFSLGYAEVTAQRQRYNTVILVDAEGGIIGKYRQIHASVQSEYKADAPLQQLKKKIFEVGDGGFRVWNLGQTRIGMCISNDQRWPETFRVLSLQGAELVVLGYNMPSQNNENHPGLRVFAQLLTLQASAYQNALWIGAAAKCGVEDGFHMLGGSVIVTPTGEIVAQASGAKDEVIVARIDPSLGKNFRHQVFNFAKHPGPEADSLIASQSCSVDLEQPWNQEFSRVVSKLDVYYLFRHILGRLPSESEWLGHCGFIGNELSEVVKTYIGSPEFKSRELTGFTPRGIAKVDLPDYVMYVAENDYGVGANILATRNYEPAVSAIFRAILKPGMTVIDIGANIGWFSMLSASIVGNKGRVFSFEPGAVNGRFLVLNKSVNSFEQVTLILAAASDRIESLAYSSSLSNGFVTDLQGAGNEAILTTDVVFAAPVDNFVPADLPVHLIKVHVEGWEMKAVRGAARIVEQWKPKVIAEFSPPALIGCSGVSGEDFLAHFRELGYVFHVIRQGQLLSCGADIVKVIEAYERSKIDHVDILMMHPSNSESVLLPI